ncbi:hypothetical protein BRADI_2g14090v3 [Brachypodium distachyon]|uniref:Uncharacterized protein n=1 Tax=Brachypodium distachyon TaxID=15368 RepID=A0A0Q3QSQ1_BRADI|nr:hypothetical protein BRADI_2g14090v3 [Brachypodium distachyon]
MDPLPDIYPLTGLQIGDMQSYISRAFLYFAPVSKKVLILVDNQPWMTSKQSRSARLWQFMITKYRMSPFVNSRASAAGDKSSNNTSSSGRRRRAMQRWFAVTPPAQLLHGFLVFEVSWRDVHGINYFNDLLTDTSLALEARYMKKWEFHSAEQAAACTSQWFLDADARSLRGYLLRLHQRRDYSASAGEEDDDDDQEYYMASSSSPRPPRDQLQLQQQQQVQDPAGSCCSDDDNLRTMMNSSSKQLLRLPTLRRRKSWRRSRSSSASRRMQQAYNDTLLMFRFRDGSLPFKLREIIMADIRLLTLLESGLPSWVIFLQSYPVLCHAYRPWMRPLARSLYAAASLVTVIIGFYDLYKNVPLLKSAAARICGPLFGWIETWDMVTRIQYLGTILFLRNLRRCLQGLFALLRALRALLRAVAAPFADLEMLGWVATLAAHAWGLAVDIGELLWAPFDVLLDCAAGAAASLWPLLQLLVFPFRFAVALAGCAGAVLSNGYNFSKDVWETLSSIFELNHMSDAQQSALLDVTTLKTLWNDLFSQIFRALRGILNGILVFFASCNRHRLSIYNHAHSRLRHMLRVARLAPRHSNHQNHQVFLCLLFFLQLTLQTIYWDLVFNFLLEPHRLQDTGVERDVCK